MDENLPVSVPDASDPHDEPGYFSRWQQWVLILLLLVNLALAIHTFLIG